MLPAIEIAYISAGSNVGNRKANIQFALKSLNKGGAFPLKVSSYYETEPVGFYDQSWFLNVAIKLETKLTAYQLLNLCQGIEAACGRVRTHPNAPRTLDLDILLYGTAIMNAPQLVIPHPRLAERRFVLEPLAQIAPEVFHPLLKQPIQSLLETCADTSTVRLLH